MSMAREKAAAAAAQKRTENNNKRQKEFADVAFTRLMFPQLCQK